MARIRKTVYYAHSMRTYGTPKESEELYMIKLQFRWPFWRVVNPAELTWDRRPNMSDFFKLVEASNAVVFSAYRGFIGRGVYEEVRVAQELGRPVYLVDDTWGGRPFNGELQIHDANDWAFRYATIEERDLVSAGGVD